MSKTENDGTPAAKRTIKQYLSIWGRNKTTAWFVIAASFILVVTGGFLLGWRNVLSGVVFGAAATLFGGLLLKYLDWQMKERRRLELKRAERDKVDQIIKDFQDALSAYKEAEKIRDSLPEEQHADFEMPNYPALTAYDLFILMQGLNKQPLSNTESELFKLLYEMKEDVIWHLSGISLETDIISALMLRMAYERGVDTQRVINIVLQQRNKRRQRN